MLQPVADIDGVALYVAPPLVIVSVAPTVYDEPLAVIVVEPCFSVAVPL